MGGARAVTGTTSARVEDAGPQRREELRSSSVSVHMGFLSYHDYERLVSAARSTLFQSIYMYTSCVILNLIM
jgi:hypothetical protein